MTGFSVESTVTLSLSLSRALSHSISVCLCHTPHLSLSYWNGEADAVEALGAVPDRPNNKTHDTEQYGTWRERNGVQGVEHIEADAQEAEEAGPDRPIVMRLVG